MSHESVLVIQFLKIVINKLMNTNEGCWERTSINRVFHPTFFSTSIDFFIHLQIMVLGPESMELVVGQSLLHWRVFI